MSTAEKLQTIAENEQKVFYAGYEKGKSEGGGGDDYIPYVSGVAFSSAISEITDDIYLDLPNVTTISNLFRERTLNCEKVTVKVSNKCTTFKWAFGGNLANENLKTIEILGDTSSVTDFSAAFRNRKNLESIIGNFDCSSVTNFSDMFINVDTIKEFFPKAGTIKTSISFSGQADLTYESVRAIINGLADMTGADTSPVLTLCADVKANLTEEQIATITGKNWTLA